MVIMDFMRYNLLIKLQKSWLNEGILVILLDYAIRSHNRTIESTKEN